MTFVIKGFEKLQAQLRKLPKEMLDATAAGQFNAAQEIMALAKSRAPFEHGTLEESAYVADPRYGSASATVEMGFGGDAGPYMLMQHENMEYQHPGEKSQTSDPGRAAQGQAKFLESAINDSEEDARAAIAEAVNYYIRTGRHIKLRGDIQKREA